jgi:hypothetical protein
LILPAGSYVLEFGGHITGSAGGSYAGVLNVGSVAAVPEPAGLLLALAGLAFLGLAGQRVRR